MERCRLGFIGLLVVLFTCMPAVILACTSTQFDCGDGDRCIPIHWVCDGETDCTESMADEANCDQHSCGDLFECSASRDEGLFPYCVPQVWDCDQEEDCALGEDELCICADDEFRCPDGDCIPQYYVCDSVHDCTGGVDEDNCTYAACPNGTFTCGNHHCIPEDLVCNGIIDCGDAADEKDTLCATVDCGTQFKCDNGQCIDFPLICNQQDDCGDNTDEIGCGINECQNTTLNTCSHGCTNIAIGFTCNCPPGYELMDDERTCQDINECEAMPRGCTQVCENSLSSFTCSCNDTYHLDNAICRLNSGEEQPHIIFANRYYIRKMNLDGSGYVTLLNDTELVHVLDFDRVEQKIYYADAKTGEIKKINYTGTPEPSHAHVLIWHDLPLVEGLAVDWVARKIYWTDSKKMALSVAEMNGTHVKTFLDGNTTRPRGIVLHPAKGYVFWTDWGMEPFIGRVGMDGEGFVPLITEDLFWPNGIAIDLFIDKIWWCDAYLDHIEYADLDGGNRHVVLASLPHLYAISIWEEWVYWSDWNIKTVERANRFTGLGRENIRNISQQPFDIHVVQPSLQPVIANPCSDNNGGCSHLCLIKNGGGGFTCACPNNFYLNEDKKTCTANCSAAHYECGVTDHRCIPLTWVCDGEPDCKGGEDEKENCPTRNCAVGLFQCDNIEDCTYMTNVCDTYNDCPDGSDEKEEFCANVTCLDDQFRCNSGRCVPLSWKCDNEQDCSDGEDEPASCLIDQECEEGEFRCNNSLCIPESWFCDYDDDCGDASDEPRDKCLAETSCQAEWRRCPNNYRCIPELLLCDGNDDCRDNSDEDPSMCPDCDEEGDFTCDNGHCIPLRWQCDREEDCADGSDENDCELIASSCSEDEFACDNGYCIRRRYYCDHDDDCGDGSDEPDICPDNECEASEWQCASGHCIDADYKCDQERDCLDVSDEADCPPAQCQSYEFACTGTNVCVPLSWRCDTEDDCGDGSDETIAVCSQISCDGINRHQCDNGRCIFSYMLCNGVDNCGDGSDENNFGVCSPHPMCNATSFKCANLNCTSPGNLCNFVDDCGDASDEIGCHHGSDGCASNNGGCMQNCTTLFDSDQQPSGHICTCRHGYIADPNQKTNCIDVDECATYTSGCQQGCTNTQGSFGCSCHDGVPSFSRVHVTTTEAGVSLSVCEPGDSSEAAILLAVESSIRQIYTKAGQMTDAILYAKKIKSISVDTGVNSNGQALLYWTDNTAKAVYRSAMPMQYSEVALPQLVFAPSSNSDLSTPDGIAVDWVSKNLYLTDSVKGVIMVMKDDGRYPKTLISTQPRKPSAIAVAPELGWMFWCDPVFAKIEKAWMDGTHISSLYNREMIEPSGITVDYFAYNRIYWVDAKKQSVETILPDGTGHFVVKQGVVHPYALDVFMNDLHWISILPDLTASVKKMDKYARGVMTTVESGFTVRPEDVVVYHSSKYPKLDNRCFNKGCPALCLLVPDDAVCACPDSGEGSADSCTFTEQQPLAMPQLCHCYNEGVCVYDSSSLPVCQCKDGFEGAQCEKNVSGPSTTIGGSSMVAIIVSIVVILLVVLVALVAFYFLIYRRRLHEKSSGHGTVRMGAPGQNQNGDFPNAAGITGMEYNVENDVAATRFSNPMYDQLNSNQQQPQAGAPPKPDPHYEELPAKSEVGAPTSMYTQA